MSSQIANSRCICSKTTGSACSIPPSVSSLKTTPNPNVSSGALRSHTVISWRWPVAARQLLRERAEVEAAGAATDHRDPHAPNIALS